MARRNGPRALTNAEKALRGETRPSRQNEAEPEYEVALPDPPEHLKPDKIAMRQWGRKSEALHRSGVLTEVDDAVLSEYCDSFAEKARLVRARRKFKPGTVEYKRIAVHINQVSAQLHRAMTELGITPSSRTRVKATPKPKGNDFDRFGP